jgi:hypothetical protein
MTLCSPIAGGLATADSGLGIQSLSNVPLKAILLWSVGCASISEVQPALHSRFGIRLQSSSALLLLPPRQIDMPLAALWPAKVV